MLVVKCKVAFNIKAVRQNATFNGILLFVWLFIKGLAFKKTQILSRELSA